MAETEPGNGESPRAPVPFRCKVLKPPRADLDLTNRVVTHPPIEVVAGVIRRGSAVLITQRHPSDMLGGYWEFPGGKVEPGEELAAALERELQEEIGVETRIGLELQYLVHPYPDRDVRLHFYAVEIVAGEPSARDVADLRWVEPADLDAYQFPDADRPLLALLLAGEGETPS